jgi:hypothetical protein
MSGASTRAIAFNWHVAADVACSSCQTTSGDRVTAEDTGGALNGVFCHGCLVQKMYRDRSLACNAGECESCGESFPQGQIISAHVENAGRSVRVSLPMGVEISPAAIDGLAGKAFALRRLKDKARGLAADTAQVRPSLYLPGQRLCRVCLNRVVRLKLTEHSEALNSSDRRTQLIAMQELMANAHRLTGEVWRYVFGG